MPDLEARHYAFADFPGGSYTALTATVERSFLASLSDEGWGKVVFQLSDSADGAISPGDIITFDLFGVRAFAMLCRKFERVAKDPGEYGAKLRTRTGPGHFGIFSKGALPPPGGVDRSPTTDTIVWDYSHPEYDDSGWPNATVIETVENAKGYYDETTFPVVPIVGEEPTWPIPWAQDMPQHAIAGVGSGTTMIVGPSSGTLTSAPVGDCYLRDYFTTSYDGVHEVYFTVDNTGELWIDGKQITTAGTSGNPLESGFIHATIVAVSLSAGDHVIAIKVSNWPSFGGANPIGAAAAIYVPGYPPTLVWESTSSMKITEYPAETPGMTYGNVALLVLGDQQTDLGLFTYITPTFDAVNDTDGNPWDVVQITSRVGVDLLSFFKEAGATYAENEMDSSGWDWNAYVPGGKGGASGVTLETGNLTVLRQVGEEAPASKLLVRWAGGWSYVGAGDAVALLELGVQFTAPEVARIAAGQLVVYGSNREQITVGYEPRNDGERPWLNAALVTGATVTVPDSSDSPVSERVVELGAREAADTEYAVITLTAKDVVLEVEERFVRDLKL